MRARWRGLFAMCAVLVGAPGIASSQTLTALWDPNPATDNVTSYQVCVGTTSLSCNFQNATVPSSETSFTFIPNPGVLYRVAVRAISSAGVGSYSPEVAVSIPALSAIANRTSNVNTPITPFNVTATDPDGGTLQFTHTGLPFGLALNSATGAISGTPIANGTYNVTIFVTDGLSTAAAAFVWTIQSGSSDSSAPTVAITSHTANQTVTSANVTLSGTATDSGAGGSGIANVTVNGVAATGGTATGSNTANWSRALTLVSGANLLTVIATDGAGNASTSTITLNVSIPDTTAPTLSITSHTNNQIVSTASITLAGTATDSGAGGSGIASVTVNGIAAAGGTATGSNTSNWSTSVALAASANVVTVIATDGKGNARQSQITINRDSAAPAVTITSPTSGQTVTTSSITVSGTASDSATGGNGITSVTVNGASATGGTASGTGTANWSRSVSLAGGANTITVVGRDGAGNTTTLFINVTYTAPDTTAPSLTISSHTNGQTMTTTSITLSGTATDNGTGGGGITSVTVNGAAATGGTATGTATANWSSPLTLALGSNTITVVARDGSGNARTATLTLNYDPPTVIGADSVGPASGSATTQTFALQYSDTRGATDLSQAWVWFNGTFGSTGNNSCMVYYDRPGARLYMLNDAGTAWTPGTLGTASTLQNSQCAINLAASSAVVSGNNLNLNLAATFKAAFAGVKNIYMYAANGANANSAWQTRGSWTIPGASGVAVTADAVTPASGSGLTQTFALAYSDTAGASELSSTWVWFNATFGATANNSCMLYYDRPGARLYLLNDAGAAWSPGTLGTASTLQNSQCSIALANSSVSLSGNTLTLNLATTFKSAFAGAKNIYMYAANGANANSAWQTRGSWTVGGAGVASVTVGNATPNSGSGSTQTFALPYSDTAGATDLSTVWAWFTGSFGSAANSSCMVYYDRAAARVYLLNDAGTAWMSGTLGTTRTLQNLQCSLNLAGSSVTLSGNTLTLNLAMTFKPAFAGAKNLYLYGQNAASVNSGWQVRGTWTAQ